MFDFFLNPYFKQEGTPSSSTGPEAAKVGTVFMFIESSSPRQDNDKAIMVTNMSLPSMYYTRVSAFEKYMFSIY